MDGFDFRTVMSTSQRSLRTISDIFTTDDDCPIATEIFPFNVVLQKSINIKYDRESKGPPTVIVTREDKRFYIVLNAIGAEEWQIKLASVIGVPDSIIDEYIASQRKSIQSAVGSCLQNIINHPSNRRVNRDIGEQIVSLVERLIAY